jgi:hypothetical protein
VAVYVNNQREKNSGEVKMLMKFKGQKALYTALAAGIIGFAIYGVFHTVQSISDEKDQNKVYAVTPESSPNGGTIMVSDGICNPLGCAACGGCGLEYSQTVKIPTGDTGQGEELY